MLQGQEIPGGHRQVPPRPAGAEGAAAAAEPGAGRAAPSRRRRRGGAERGAAAGGGGHRGRLLQQPGRSAGPRAGGGGSPPAPRTPPSPSAEQRCRPAPLAASPSLPLASIFAFALPLGTAVLPRAALGRGRTAAPGARARPRPPALPPGGSIRPRWIRALLPRETGGRAAVRAWGAPADRNRGSRNGQDCRLCCTVSLRCPSVHSLQLRLWSL